MEIPIEVVISHDILEVPYADSTQYVWAATQTFTILHLSDLGADAEVCDPVTVDDDSDLYGYLALNPELCSHADETTIDTGDEDDLKEWRRELIASDDDGDQLQSEGKASCKDDSRSLIAAEKTRFLCGICDDTFESEIRMHCHRIEHFGYFSGITRSKTCFVCGAPFVTIKATSEHLYAHYPGTIRERVDAAMAEDEMHRTTRKSKSHSETPKSIDTNSIPPSPERIQSKICYSPPELQHKNYPVTNNERLASSDSFSISNSSSSSSSSSSNHALDNCKYDSNNFGTIKKRPRNWHLQQYDRGVVQPFECGVCEMKFSFARSLHQHRLRHFGYFRAQGSLKCVFCGKVFTNLSYMSEHLMQHYTTAWETEKNDEIGVDLS